MKPTQEHYSNELEIIHLEREIKHIKYIISLHQNTIIHAEKKIELLKQNKS